MKLCIRENYIDKTALTRFSETELIKQPYNFSFVEIDEKYKDCEYCDFDFVNNSFVFNETKYNSRKTKEENETKITELKEKLTSWDYKTSKYIDGDYSNEQWNAIKTQRIAWRKEIEYNETLIN